MKTPHILASALAVILLAGAAPAQSPDAAGTAQAAGSSRNQVVVTYFHGDVRCATCKKLEAYAKAAVEKAFAAELADGRLVFRTVNTDRPENAHFLTDYSLVTKSLVVTEESGGKVLRWTNLDRIWRLVGDRQAYDEYVVAGVRAHLGTSS